MKNKPIIKRIYYKIEFKLVSPLNVASGNSYYTDSDVIRNGDNIPFIPGTSIAGAFRNYCYNKNIINIFGDSEGKSGSMSSIYISDVYFEDNKNIENKYVISMRDGIALSEDKSSTENKFDMEIIETGAKGTLYIECVVRDEKVDYEKSIIYILCGQKSGEIRLGKNKNRGFGKVGDIEIKKKIFNKEDLDEWLDFTKEKPNIRDYGTTIQIENNVSENNDSYNFVKIIVPLSLTGGISIRKYSAEPDKADFEHITCNEMPVIPGSSWNGAIRSVSKEILTVIIKNHNDNLNEKKLKYHDIINDFIDSWFGTQCRQSKIIISESVIKNSKRQKVVRNKINRFDASTINGALYSEIAYFGGTTDLEILIRNNDINKEIEENKEENICELKAICELLDLVIEDILNGYVPIGGQVSIGRGIFELQNDNKKLISGISIDDSHSNLFKYFNSKIERKEKILYEV